MTNQEKMFNWEPVQLTDCWEESAELVSFDLEYRYPNAETSLILDALFFETERMMNRQNEYPPIDWTDQDCLRFLDYLSKRLVKIDNLNRVLRK